MRLIDADAIGNPYENTSLAFEFMVLKKILDDAPTVDAVSREEYDKLKDLCEQYRYERDVLEDAQRNKVEVVRCKDCKWVRKAGTLMGENPVPVYGCHNTGVYVFEDGYCDVGERKEE